MDINQLSNNLQKELFENGHRLCMGCPEAIIVKLALGALKEDENVIVCSSTGCLEVCSSIFPINNWKVPWIHNAFETAASTMSGVEAAYRVLKKKGKYNLDKKKVKFLIFSGDGGTYDIGMQALSGAAERGHDFVYICINNGGYMNTGNQRSSATPLGASTSTTGFGKSHKGKEKNEKEMSFIMADHHIPYVANASPSHLADFVDKVRKALDTEGPSFINALAACPREWKFDYGKTVELGKLGYETWYWPLYEIKNGTLMLNYKSEKKAIEEFLKPQKRFSHLLEPENKQLLDNMKSWLDKREKWLRSMDGKDITW